jgi:excisionase family DNA binding protein
MPTTTDRRTISVEEAAKMLGVGRSTAYEAARSGSLAGVPVIKVGRRQLLSRDRFEAVLGSESKTETA